LTLSEKFKVSVCACMAAVLCLFSGCAQEKTDEGYRETASKIMSGSFSFDAKVKAMEYTAEVSVSKSAEGDIGMKFHSPEVLNGLDVREKGGKLTVLYRELEVDISSYDIPAQSIVTVIKEALSEEGLASAETEVSQEEVVFKGTAFLSRYRLCFSKKDMKLLRIEFPGLDVQITVENFKSGI